MLQRPTLLLIAPALLLGGCASSLTAFYNRSVVKDNVGEVATVSLSADRRTVLVGTDGDNRGKFCAEPPPDSATGLKTDLEASMKASAKLHKTNAEGAVEVSGKDKMEQTVVVLAERTPALDAFRTGVYALCQFHLNGAVKDAQVSELFTKLIQAYEATAGKKAQGSEPQAPGVRTAANP